MSKAINYNLSEYDLRPLPSDSKLEKMVLGLFLDVPSLVEQMNKYLMITGIFYDNINTKVWQGIKAIIDFKMRADVKNVEGYFTRQGDEETALYVKCLPAYSGEFYMIKQYCIKLFELAILRSIIRIGSNLRILTFSKVRGNLH